MYVVHDIQLGTEKNYFYAAQLSLKRRWTFAKSLSVFCTLDRNLQRSMRDIL